MQTPLAPADALLLAFEAEHQDKQIPPGLKARLVDERFDMDLTRYHQRLITLLDSPAAMEWDPVLVAALRAPMERRRAQRSRARLIEVSA